MAAPANVSEAINRLTGGNSGFPENVWWSKDPTGFTTLAGVWQSLWTVDGVPGAGVVPSSGVVPTNATPGALRHIDATSGRKRWLRSAGFSAWFGCRVILYDRLFHIGGLSGTVTTPQAVGGAITRYTGQASVGNFAMVEVYTLIGATPVSVSCNYLDKDGASRASPASDVLYYGRQPGNCIWLPYNVADGANSITSVTNVTLSGSTAIAGNFGVTICRPLLEVDIGAVDTVGIGHGVRELMLEDLEILPGACLGVMVQGLTGTTAQNFVRGSYTTFES